MNTPAVIVGVYIFDSQCKMCFCQTSASLMSDLKNPCKGKPLDPIFPGRHDFSRRSFPLCALKLAYLAALNIVNKYIKYLTNSH